MRPLELSDPLEPTARKVIVGLILASLTLQLFIGLLETGHDATRYGTIDSKGYPLGFNDPITWGHVRIMFGNATWTGFVETVEWYGLLCCAAHLIGLWVVCGSAISLHWRQIYFAAQLFVFPIGWFFPLWVWFLATLLTGGWDGESIQDGPLNALFAQGIWTMVSLAALIHLLWREERLGELNQTLISASETCPSRLYSADPRTHLHSVKATGDKRRPPDNRRNSRRDRIRSVIGILRGKPSDVDQFIEEIRGR